MARKASVRYWPGRKGGGYFCVFQGKRHELALGPDDSPSGSTYLAALDAFKKVVKGEPAKSAASGDSIRFVLDTYLKHISRTKKPGTIEMRLRSFAPFVNHPAGSGLLGEKPVSGLTHMDVYRFLESMENPRTMVRKKAQMGRKPIRWGQGSKRNFLQGVGAAFNWAVRSKLIAENPLLGIEKPPTVSRGAESLIGTTAQEIKANHEKILAAVPPSYRPFIQALKDTGARPGELCAVTAADFQSSIGAFVFHKEATRRGEQFSHKTARKKDRVIFLSGPTLDLVKELVVKYPAGPIFRRKHDKPFARVSIVDRFIKLRRKLPMPNLTAYSYRHTFATEMLKAGCDIDTLAELMGNSAMVIRQHYSHLLADAQGLRSKLERFKMAAAGT